MNTKATTAIRSALVGVVLLFAPLLAGPAIASTVEFVPPNDTVGSISSGGLNDGWNFGRGIGFTVSSDQTINSVGVFENLTGIDLAFKIAEIPSLTGTFSAGTTLRSGGSTVTTTGLEWIDYSFSDLTLTPGTDYWINFYFDGTPDQKFYYDNHNVAWNQGAFRSLEGTQGNDFANSLVAAFRVNGVATVPLPAGLPLFASGLGVIGLLRWRRKRQVAA